ncbi:MAG: sulfotransferase family protein [Actinomycetota bacterium]
MGRSARPNGAEDGRLPDFVVIGAMRAGTTSLARYLGAHPNVFMPSKKELHFFDWNYGRATDWYRTQFADASPGDVAGEATPIYIVYPESMRRLATDCPDARLLVVLRDPVSRAYSHYLYNRMLGFEPLGFREAIDAEQQRPPAMTDRRTFDYVARGRYLEQLRRVSELFPREALHVLLLEDMKRDAAGTYRDVCRFLGVDDAFRPENLGESLNSYSTYRSKALAKAARSLPAPVARVARRVNRRPAAPPPMPADVRAELERRFAEDNASLASWLGKDLSVWWSSDRERPASPARAD